MTVLRYATRDGPRWCYDFRHRGRRYAAGAFRSKDDATQAEAVAKGRAYDARLAAEYGLRPPRARIPTLEAFAAEFIAGRAGSLAPATRAVERSLYAPVRRALGAHLVSDVTPALLTAHRDARLQEVSANHLRSEWHALKRLFRAAQRAGYRADNPAHGVPLPRATPTRSRAIDAREERALLRAAKGELADLLRLAVLTGLRPAELCLLAPAHVDLRARAIRLVQPKTGRAKLVPLAAEAVAILRARHPPGGPGPVFRNARGRPWTPGALGLAFRRLRRKAGLEGVRLYDLRHTAATRLYRASKDLVATKDVLGHRSKAVWEYVDHGGEERSRQAVEAMEAQGIPKRIRKKRR